MADEPDVPDPGDDAGWAAPDHGTPDDHTPDHDTPDHDTDEPAPPTPPPPQPSPAAPPPPPIVPPATPPPPTDRPGVAPVAAPSTVPQDRAPKRRRGWVIVLLAAIAVIVVSLIAGTVLFVDRTKPPYDAAHDFLETHLGSGRVDRLLCAADRDNPDEAVSSINQTLSVVGRAEVAVNPLGVDRSDDVATVKYSVDPSVGATHTFELPLRLEGGVWRVCPSDGVHEVDR